MPCVKGTFDLLFPISIILQVCLLVKQFVIFCFDMKRSCQEHIPYKLFCC